MLYAFHSLRFGHYMYNSVVQTSLFHYASVMLVSRLCGYLNSLTASHFSHPSLIHDILNCHANLMELIVINDQPNPRFPISRFVTSAKAVAVMCDFLFQQTLFFVGVVVLIMSIPTVFVINKRAPILFRVYTPSLL